MPFPSPTFTNFIRSAGNYLADEFENVYAQFEGYLRTEHEADGSHGDVTADSVEIRPHGWVSGESPLNGTSLLTKSGVVFPSGDFITNLPNIYSPGEVWSVKNNLFIGPGTVTFIGDINTGSISVATGETITIGGVEQGAWTSYTPTWTGSGGNPSIGDGTLDGSYARIGDTGHFKIRVVIGSTTNVGTGVWSFSLPWTTVAASRTALGAAFVFDSGTAFLVGTTVHLTTTTVGFITHNVTNTGGSAIPVTWAQNDYLQLEGTVEIA